VTADVPREAWEIFFPMIAWGTLKQEAKRYCVDPYIACGLIRQKASSIQTRFLAWARAASLQIMPATGQLIAKRQGNGAIAAADLYNPVLNIKLGMNYLAQMIGEYRAHRVCGRGLQRGAGASAGLDCRAGLDGYRRLDREHPVFRNSRICSRRSFATPRTTRDFTKSKN